MDKVRLNNQLLANKKKVLQAKVNVINKLVQKIRKFKKTNDSILKKKIDRTVEILACVKKLQCVDLLKKSLLNETRPTQIITNGNSPPEATAEALLFEHKIVLNVTKQLKELFNLNDDDNPGWKNMLELNKKKEKLRIIKEKRRNQDGNGSFKLDKKRSLWLEQNLLSIDNKRENEDSSHCKENILGEKYVKDLFVSNEAIRDIEKSTEIIDENEVECTQHSSAVDPFFVTNSGENYLSSVVINRVQPGPFDDGLVRKERRAELYGYMCKKSYRRLNDEMKHRMESNNKKQINVNKETYKDLHPSWAAKQKNRGISEFRGKIRTFDDDSLISPLTEVIKNTSESAMVKTLSLHPSWEAKQKMKSTIADFKGTKIVFDD